jgi:hypothetical protein
MARRSHEIGGCESDTPRSLDEILDRALALGAAVAAGFDAPRGELLQWIRESNLEAALTLSERAFLDGSACTDKDVIRMTWCSERLIVLLWALGKLEEMPSVDTQCSMALLEKLLPPYGDESLKEFRATARLRTEDELFDMAFEIQELNVVARQRVKVPGYRPNAPHVDREVIDERHRAVNWVVGYESASWDTVTSDT